MVENLPAGAVYVNASDGSITTNKAAEAITGYQRDELVNADAWFEAVFGDESEAVRALCEQDKASKTFQIVRKDGQERHVEVAAYEDEWCTVWLLNDVTDRERAEELLFRRTHELGERVKELRCLYDISHLMEKRNISLGEILQGAVELVPLGAAIPADRLCANHR